jgi:hypothetical protein
VRGRAALVLTATTFGIAACGDAEESPCPERFATSEWKAAAPGSREKLRLARQAVTCRFVKYDDSKRQVTRVLGRAERDELQSPSDYRREWLYYVGETNGYMGPADAQFLSVRFGSDDRVGEASVEP